jgi:hypothetical protein
MNHAQGMEEYHMGNPSPGLSHRHYSPGRMFNSWDGMAMSSGEINHRFARGQRESPGLVGRSPVNFLSEPMLAAPVPPPRNYSVFVSNVNAVRPRLAARKDASVRRPMLSNPADTSSLEVCDRLNSPSINTRDPTHIGARQPIPLH